MPYGTKKGGVNELIFNAETYDIGIYRIIILFNMNLEQIYISKLDTDIICTTLSLF